MHWHIKSNNIETTSDTHAWGRALITDTGLMKAFAKLTRPCLIFKSLGVRRPRLWSLLHDALALRSHALCAVKYLSSNIFIAIELNVLS